MKPIGSRTEGARFAGLDREGAMENVMSGMARMSYHEAIGGSTTGSLR